MIICVIIFLKYINDNRYIFLINYLVEDLIGGLGFEKRCWGRIFYTGGS